MIEGHSERRVRRASRLVVLLSGHYYASKRRAGFHWLADALWRAGFDVLFVTTQISWISWLRRDPRFQYPIFSERKRFIERQDGFRTYVWFTPWHPANTRSRLLNKLTAPLARRYGELHLGPLEEELRRASVVIFESDLGLFLFPRVRRLAPAAKLVYRVSDDLRVLKNHPELLDVEAECLSQFDVVSTASSRTMVQFGHHPNLAVHPHGVQKELFDECRTNPYASGTLNAIYVGIAHFDVDFIERASRLRPDIQFHVIGPISGLPDRPNVIAYGERPFVQTIPYIKFADIGLQSLSYTPGAEWFADSLKIQQYTYCRLPIVAPDYLRSERGNLFLYEPGSDAAIARALADALAFDRSSVDPSSVRTWDDLVAVLV